MYISTVQLGITIMNKERDIQSERVRREKTARAGDGTATCFNRLSSALVSAH